MYGHRSWSKHSAALGLIKARAKMRNVKAMSYVQATGHVAGLGFRALLSDRLVWG
jgi:hypothetical protein